MNQQSTEKQIIHWNTLTFTQLVSIVDLIDRKQQYRKPHSYDYVLRDFFFNPNFQIFGYKSRPSFIEQSAQWIQHFTSFNQLGFLQSVSFEHQMEKHRFWNKIYKMYVKQKSDHEAKEAVTNIVWTYRLIPIALFCFAAVTISKLAGIYKMSYKKQFVGIFAAAVIGDFFVKARKSSDIFYLIPPLNNQTLEEQRLNILNNSIVIDGKINEVQFHPTYIDQLVEQAEKEEKQQQRKLILEAAGYTIVDKVDFQY